MKLAKLSYFLAITLIVGCEATPLHELNYRGKLPPLNEADYTMAVEFAKELSDITGLRVKNAESPSGHSQKRTSFVDLSSIGEPKITVNIMTVNPDQVLLVSIRGDIESEAAKAIGQKAQALFAKKYPNSRLVKYQAHQTILGP